MLEFLAILIGYLLGSISPAYILGKVLRGIDIRQYGTKNAGTTNVKRVLGLGPAVICAIYDLTKGLLVMLLAYKLGVAPAFIFASGYFAVLGHVFPFYLRFRGGQGVATAVGILLFNLYLVLHQNFLPWPNFLVLALMVLFLLLITKQGEMIGLVILPALMYFIYKNYGLNTLTFFTGVIVFHIFVVNIVEAVKLKLFVLKPETKKELLIWRAVLRPAAVVFPVLYFLFGKKYGLILLASVAGVFLVLDLVRLASKGVNLFFFKKVVFFFKEREAHQFSSITLFLVGSFLTFLVFDKTIAITAVIFLIFGDLFAKFFRLQYGKINFIRKSLEGFLAYFGTCLVIGFALMNYLPLTPLMIVVGSLAASLAESFPAGFDDNFAVPLVSAGMMYLVSFI